MAIKTAFSSITILLCAFILTAIPTTGIAVESPASVSRKMIRDGQSLIKVPPSERRARADLILKDRFATRDFLKLALRNHWGGLDEEKRGRLEKAFPEALSNNIIKRLERIHPGDVAEFRLQSVKKMGTIRAAMVTGRWKDLDARVEMLLINVNNKWVVMDVVVNGASMRENYEGQFNYIIRKHGIDELIRRMEKKAGLHLGKARN